MDICSPKDGFVIDLLVTKGQEVKAGTTLLQMDSDFEDHAIARLQLMENSREIRNEQYSGDQLKLQQDLAQLAVDMATKRLAVTEKVVQVAMKSVDLGLINGPAYILDLKTQNENAALELKRAQDQQKQLNYAIDRHNRINSLAKKSSIDNIALLQARRERLKVVSPIEGHIKTIQIAKGSFAELGGVLCQIE